MNRVLGIALVVAGLAAGSAGCAFPGGAVEGVTEARIATISGANGWAVNRPKQRKLFVIHDALWLFFVDGASLRYVTSPTGEAWSSPITVRDARMRVRLAAG